MMEMRKGALFPLLAGLMLAVSSPTPVAAGSPAPVGETGYGNIRIGTSAETLLGSHTLSPDRDSQAAAGGDSGCYYAFLAPGQTQPAFIISEKRLVRIDFDQPDVITLTGIRPGDSLASLRRTFGPGAPYRLEHEPAPGDDADNFTYITLPAKDSHHGIAYLVAEGKVSSIMVGELSALHWSEGCI